MSSAPDFKRAFTWLFVGFAPPWPALYAWTIRAETPAVTGVAWDVPLNRSKAKLPSQQYTFRGPASRPNAPMLMMSGLALPSRVGPRLEKDTGCPEGPGPKGGPK